MPNSDLMIVGERRLSKPVPHPIPGPSVLRTTKRRPPPDFIKGPLSRAAYIVQSRSLYSRMRPDELPVYPTPQQASYSTPPQNNAPRKPKNQHPGGGTPNPHSYGHSSQLHSRPQASSHHSQQLLQLSSYLQQPPHSYQGGRPYQQQPPPPQPQQYSSMPQPQYYSQGPPIPQVTSAPPAQYNNHYAQGNGYQQNQAEPYVNPNPQYYNSPPVGHNLSSGSSKPNSSLHNSQPQYSDQYQSPSQVLASNRQGSYTSQTSNSGNNYSNEQRSPNMATQSRKKPPMPSNHSKESVSDAKAESKQRLEVELRSTFERVDTNRSGRISVKELSSALVNFDNTGFQESTVQLMIKLFTSSGSPAGLNFEQFVSLWKYLTAYKKLFVAADTNKSGDISFGEFQRILEQIGYKLNVDVVLHLFLKFVNKDNYHFTTSAVGKLKFDAFIELLVYIRKLTDIFKQYDKDLSGVATINYLDFLMEISNLT